VHLSLARLPDHAFTIFRHCWTENGQKHPYSVFIHTGFMHETEVQALTDLQSSLTPQWQKQISNELSS
jgi:hypothetical protein